MSQKTSLPAVSPQKIKSRMLALSMARRFVQLAVLALFIGTVRLGWTLLGEPLLNGTLTSSLIAGSVPMSDPFALLQKLFAGHKPELTMVTGALIVLAIYVIAGGRAFCAWVCPMNIVTDAAYSARKSLNVPASSLRLSRHARYALAAAALLASAVSGTAAFEWVSPQAFLWRELIWGVGAGLIAAVTGVFALDLLLLERGWCGHLCPLGAFWSVVGKVGVVKPTTAAPNAAIVCACVPKPTYSISSSRLNEASSPRASAPTAVGALPCAPKTPFDSPRVFKPSRKQQNRTTSREFLE